MSDQKKDKVLTSVPSAVCQAIGLCFHFFGYECARAASIALLSANEIGLKSEALPLTVAVGSPASALVLYLYARSIKNNGTKFTQRISSVFCIISFLCVTSSFSSLKGNFGKFVVVSFYAYREIYCTLISTQQWSYIASVLDKSTSSYLVKFAGAVSISSAIGGCAVEQLVNIGGVLGLLVAAFICTVLSFITAEISYILNKSVPSEKEMKCNNHIKSNTISNINNSNINSSNIISNKENNNNSVAQSAENKEIQDLPKLENVKKNSCIWVDGWEMILKNNMLQMLFAEALIHQVCANMLNLMFHDGLRFSMPDDRERATLVGRFFATVNVTACIFQCFFLPIILSQSSLPYVLILIPVLISFMSFFAFMSPSLLSTMFVFGSLKVLEYSIMTAATEMIYMPMDQDVRYLGKELIRFFGHKLGKSAASLILSGIVGHLQPSLGTQSLWSAIFSSVWSVIMYVLSVKLMSQESSKPALPPLNNIIESTHQFIKRTVSKSTLIDVSMKEEDCSENSSTTSESGVSDSGLIDESVLNKRKISSDKTNLSDSNDKSFTTDDESDGTPPNIFHEANVPVSEMNYTNDNYMKVWKSGYQSGLRYRGKKENTIGRVHEEYNELEVKDGVLQPSTGNFDDSNPDDIDAPTSINNNPGDIDASISTNKRKSFTLLRVGSAFVQLSSMVPDGVDNEESFHGGNY